MAKRRNSRKKKKQQRAERRPMGLIGLILTGIVLAFVSYWFQDYTGSRLGLVGSLIWVSGLLLGFLFTLFYFGSFVLPVQEGRVAGFNLLWKYYQLTADFYLRYLGEPDIPAPSKEELHHQDPSLTHLPDSFRTLSAGLLDSHRVLAIRNGAGGYRADGPGLVVLQPGEQVLQVIDLRPHSRRQMVSATTRDGIQIETAVSVTFRVRHAAEESDLVHPYDRSAIFYVSHTTSIENYDRVRRWTAQLTPFAANRLVLLLADSTLDDLSGDAGLIAVERIKKEIEQGLRQRFGDGLDILGVGIGRFAFPEAVTQQRIESWRASWQKEMEIKQAAGEAEALRRLKKARALAQIEIIENIIQSIESVRRNADANLTEIITLRMIEALEEATSNATIRAFIPQPVMSDLMEASAQLKDWVDEDEEETEA